jgi:hypothetical protein
MSRPRLPLIAVGGLVVVLVVVALTVRPAPTGDGPGGTTLLRRFLEVRGVAVSEGDDPEGGTFFLAHDLRTPRQAGQVLDWVRGGGRLVVADPASAILARAGMRPSPRPVAGFVPEQRLRPACVSPVTVGVERIVAGALDGLFRPAAGLGCFPRDGGAYLVTRAHGTGTIVALGGITPLTNEFLDDEDDVALAWNLLGSGGPVVFGSAGPPGAAASEGLWGLLPDAARAVVLQLAGTAVLFALARGRRFGRPIEEAVPSPIPATELVLATGELYRRARATGHAADVLEGRFRARTGRRLGLGPGPDRAGLGRAVAEATGEEVPWPAAGETGDEAGLVSAARTLERAERRLEGGEGWETPVRR